MSKLKAITIKDVYEFARTQNLQARNLIDFLLVLRWVEANAAQEQIIESFVAKAAEACLYHHEVQMWRDHYTLMYELSVQCVQWAHTNEGLKQMGMENTLPNVLKLQLPYENNSL